MSRFRTGPAGSAATIPGLAAACLLVSISSAAICRAGSPEKAPDAEIIPKAADDRCGGFGWNPAVQSTVPVAYPLVMDLSFDGTLQQDAVRLSDSLAEYLGLTGAFAVNGRDKAPTGGAITWISALAFDYLGWRKAGNWMVVTATLKPVSPGMPSSGSELLEVSLMAFLTEEGNEIGVSDSTAILSRKDIPAFAGRFVNALSACITGLPGVLQTRIVYARKQDRRGQKEIFMTRVGSREQVQVSRDGSLAMLPAWGPGGAVAWTGYRKGNPDIYLDGRPFGNRPGMNTGVSFAPNGVWAAVTWAPESASDVYLLNAVSGEVVAQLTESNAIDTSPTWSPDSSKIAFVSDRLGFPQIFVMNSDGTGQHPLPLPGSYNTGPDWSPDGTTIVYQSRGKGSRFSIWAYDVQTGLSRQVSRDGFNNEEPSFSPDGRSIVYTSSRGGRKQLYIMNSSGAGAHSVFSDDAEYFTPAWERIIPVVRNGEKTGSK